MKHRDMGSRQIAAAPPLFEQPLTRGNLIRPLVSCIRTSSDITDRRPRPLPAKLTGRRPLTSFARYFFFTEALQVPLVANLRGRGR